MKKILCALLLAVLLTGSASAEKVGLLAKLNAFNTDTFEALMTKGSDINKRAVRTIVFDGGLNDVSCRFYDSLPAMIMALRTGEIDCIHLPDCAGEYILRTNPETYAKGLLIQSIWTGFAMGFRENDSALKEKVNAEIVNMTNDGSLGLLAREYISGPDAADPKPIKIDKFDGAETLKVAITGDLPPMDYVDADGQPAGYNTAIFAELGRRLHMNIEFVQVETAARASALKSGRVDCVFWLDLVLKEGIAQNDIPDGVIITAPYYMFNKTLFIALER